MIRREPSRRQSSIPLKKRGLWDFAYSPVWPGLLVAGPLIIVYLVWFFAQPGTFGPSRLHDMVGLLLPDELLRSTTGGGADHLQIGVLDRVPIVLAAMFWLGLGGWIGWPFVLPFKSLMFRMEHISLSTLIGLSFLSTATLLVGLLGLLQAHWLAIAVLALCGLSYALQKILGRRLGGRGEPPHFDDHLLDPSKFQTTHSGQVTRWIWRMVQVSTIGLAVAYLLSAMMPPFEFDVVEYHLQGPKEFYQTGQVGFVPHNVYLNMPLGTEMHSLAAMVLIGRQDAWWYGALVGKLIIGSYSLLGSCLAAGFVARHYGNIAGWVTAALILSAPGNLHVAGCGLVDSALGATIAAAVIVLSLLLKQAGAEKSLASDLNARHPPSQPLPPIANGRVAALALAFSVSLLAGAAGACKYTGLVFVWFPSAMVLCWCHARRPIIGLRYPLFQIALVLVVGFAITAGPWFVKNLVNIGNPVFPLADRWFGSHSELWTGEQADRWKEAHRTPAEPTIPGWTASSPFGWSSLLGGLHQLAVGSPMLPPALIPLSLLGGFWYTRRLLFEKRKSNAACDSSEFGGTTNGKSKATYPLTMAILFSAWILAVWWLGTHRIDRFWLPAFPLIAILAGGGAAWLISRGGMGIIAVLLLISNGYGLYLSLSGALCDQRWFVSLESLRSDHGTEDQPGRIPKTTAWVNLHLPANSNLLLIGEARVFDFQPAIEYATCFNTPPGKLGLEGKSPSEQREWLEQRGITHVLVHWREISRYRSPGNYGFSAWPSRSDIELMIRNGVLHPVENWPFDREEADLLKFQ